MRVLRPDLSYAVVVRVVHAALPATVLKYVWVRRPSLAESPGLTEQEGNGHGHRTDQSGHSHADQPVIVVVDSENDRGGYGGDWREDNDRQRDPPGASGLSQPGPVQTACGGQ